MAKRPSIPVNSSHHQSVKSVPSSFQVTAVAPDGVIEAIEASTHPFWLGVQWHLPSICTVRTRYRNAYFQP
ncbi:MAG: gamma-glutamyl-gamma-aminobutyrate hydrolase family protein [Nitrospirota bacterium]|nr:gamma-glutamyl-gamma-aminobutyrate hydrolase family protein [Nitrospirota bacterium]